MDEPFSALDAITRERLQDQLAVLLEKRGIITVIVTHSVEEAVFLGRRALVMTGSEKGSVFTAEVSNPDAGKPGSRSSESFFRLCRELRGALEKGYV